MFKTLHQTVQTLLAAAVAAAGTITVDYPAGFEENHFALTGHKISILNGGDLVQTDNFTVALGAGSAVITLGAGEATIPAGSTLFIQLNQKGNRDDVDLTTITGLTGARVSRRQIVELNLGAPDAQDVDGVFTAISQAAGAITLDGALATAGVVTFDVPRNITVDSGGADAAVITFTGTDEFGAVIVESITANGATVVQGKKAFKTITGAVSSATTANGVFAGTGDILGLPVFLPNSAFIIKELEDGAAATAGTTVAGVVVKATATTGDVRGTYLPDSTPDGALNLSILVSLEDPEYLGSSQFAG